MDNTIMRKLEEMANSLNSLKMDYNNVFERLDKVENKTHNRPAKAKSGKKPKSTQVNDENKQSSQTNRTTRERVATKNRDFGKLVLSLFKLMKMGYLLEIWKNMPKTVSNKISSTINSIHLPGDQIKLTENLSKINEMMQGEIQNMALEHIRSYTKVLVNEIMQLNQEDILQAIHVAGDKLVREIPKLKDKKEVCMNDMKVFFKVKVIAPNKMNVVSLTSNQPEKTDVKSTSTKQTEVTPENPTKRPQKSEETDVRNATSNQPVNPASTADRLTNKQKDEETNAKKPIQNITHARIPIEANTKRPTDDEKNVEKSTGKTTYQERPRSPHGPWEQPWQRRAPTHNSSTPKRY